MEWEVAPRFGNEATSRRTPRPGAYGLVCDARGLIAVVRAHDGVFLPGGGLEHGETPETGLIREAIEECGWTIRVGSLIARAIQFTPAFEKPSSFFAIEIVSRAGRGTEPGHETLWCPPAVAADALMHESHAWAVRQFVAIRSEEGHPLVPSTYSRRIVGFHQDREGHWVAELDCGHGQHVRHDPPWQVRPWVLTPEGRATRLGVELQCVQCATAVSSATRRGGGAS